MLSVSIKEIIKSVSFVKSFNEIRCVTVTVLIFGSYALHTTLTQRNLVCHFEDEITRDRSPRVQVVWVLVVFKLFRRPLLPARCSRSVFPVLGEF